MKKITSGSWLMATGVLHCLVGVLIGWETISAILSDGLFGAIAANPARRAVFWFQFGGLMMILLGALLREFETKGIALPQWLGRALISVGVIGGLLIPASGFWTLIPQGLWISRRSSHP